MGTVLRILLIFICVSLGSAFAIHHLGIPFGDGDYWQNHGWLFLIAISFFPRITLLVATLWGGFFWWLGLLFFPRILVAGLATVYYWQENPILVIFAWLIALGGGVGREVCCAKVHSAGQCVGCRH